jgi:hypothetical protein
MDPALHARVAAYALSLRLCGWITVPADLEALLREAQAKAEPAVPRWEPKVVPK